MIFGLFNVPLCLIGVVYLNSLEIGWTSTWVGFLVLALYIPIWLYTQHELRRADAKAATARTEHGAEEREKVLDLR